MGLEESQFTNNNTNFDVTFVIEDGSLEITKTKVTLTVVGHNATVPYTGEEQSVTGFDAELAVEDDLFPTSKLSILSKVRDPEAKGTEVGKYYMGLKQKDFGIGTNGLGVDLMSLEMPKGCRMAKPSRQISSRSGVMQAKMLEHIRSTERSVRRPPSAE